MTNTGHFGHGVIGHEQAAAEAEVIEQGANVFGPGVLNSGKTPEPAPASEPESKPAAPSLSVTDLEAALEENPELVETFLLAEIDRAGGPRKGALAALKSAEENRPEGPREDVLAMILAAQAE